MAPDSEFWQCHLLLPPPAVPLAPGLVALPVLVNDLIAPGSLVQLPSISVVLVINSLLYYNVNFRQARVFYLLSLLQYHLHHSRAVKSVSS